MKDIVNVRFINETNDQVIIKFEDGFYDSDSYPEGNYAREVTGWVEGKNLEYLNWEDITTYEERLAQFNTCIVSPPEEGCGLPPIRPYGYWTQDEVDASPELQRPEELPVPVLSSTKTIEPYNPYRSKDVAQVKIELQNKMDEECQSLIYKHWSKEAQQNVAMGLYSAEVCNQCKAEISQMLIDNQANIAAIEAFTTVDELYNFVPYWSLS